MWCSPHSCGTIYVVVKSAFDLPRSLERVKRALGLTLGLSLTLGALQSFFGCRSKSRPIVAAAANGPKLPPLVADSWLVELEVSGFGKAALAVPVGAKEPRQVVIALHGAADRPEWACGAWRGIAGPRPFVLCPRGILRPEFAAPDQRYTFGGADAVAAELRASLAALKHRFGAHVAPGAVVLAGFELGADRAAAIAPQEPTFFARLALVEPAPDTWPSSQAALFGRAGGERVLFVYGPAGRETAEFKAVLTRRGGAEARVVFLSDGQLGLGATTVAQLAGFWPWFSGPASHLSPPENLVGNPLAAKRPEPVPRP